MTKDKRKVYCKIFRSANWQELEDVINVWLKKSNKDVTFEITHSDHEIEPLPDGRSNITLIIFYKV